LKCKLVPISAFGKIVTGKTPDTKNKSYIGNKYLFITPNELHDGFMIDSTERKLSIEGLESIVNNTVKQGIHILVGCIGWDMGNVGIVEGKCAFNQQINAITDISDDYNPYYIYYLLSGKKELFRKVAGVTRTPILNKSSFENIEVPVLEKREQDKIAWLLTSVDKKISINKKQINTLESMAKTLYDYWFVQFDFPDTNGKPYKTSGGKMEWNETLSREIPAGWEVDNLFRIASYVNGLACQKYRPQDEEESLPVIKIREMHEGIKSDTERVSANIPLENIIYDGDILFSWSATLEIQYWTGGKAGLNQHIFKVIPSEDIPKEYVYHQLKEYIVNFVKIAEARKTTMGHITQDHLKFSRIVIPPYEVLRRFEERMKPIHKQMVKCNQENRKLIYLRDFLLPMLMNGQVTFRQ